MLTRLKKSMLHTEMPVLRSKSTISFQQLSFKICLLLFKILRHKLIKSHQNILKL
jgi:hypothetical protein